MDGSEWSPGLDDDLGAWPQGRQPRRRVPRSSVQPKAYGAAETQHPLCAERLPPNGEQVGDVEAGAAKLDQSGRLVRP
jgi:hypothetical protein